MEKLMPPLVAELRRKVKEFRDGGYVGAAETSKSLLNWWFNTPHLLPTSRPYPSPKRRGETFCGCLPKSKRRLPAVGRSLIPNRADDFKPAFWAILLIASTCVEIGRKTAYSTGFVPRIIASTSALAASARALASPFSRAISSRRLATRSTICRWTGSGGSGNRSAQMSSLPMA